MAITRLVVELTEMSQAAILRRSAQEGLNKTTITNRALQVYDAIREEEKRGYTIALLDKEGEVFQTLRFL